MQTGTWVNESRARLGPSDNDNEGGRTMDSPIAFNIRRLPPGLADPYGGWQFDGYESEAIWLPRLGPTSWALMRLFDRTSPASRTSRFVVAACASMVGTSPSRCWTSIGRLANFGVLRRDADDDRNPTFVLPLLLPRVDAKQWRRLPDVVRALHADLAPAEHPFGPPAAQRAAG